jgi:hypothetical protein
MTRVCACLFAVAAATLLLAPSAAAQAPSAAGQDGWHLRITPYLWAMSTKGDGKLGPVPVPLNATTKQVVEGLDLSFESYVEAAKGSLLLLADTHLSKVHIDIAAAPPFTGGRFTNRQVIIATGVGRRMMTRYGLIDAYGGLRYYNLDLQALYTGFPFLAGGKGEWADPIIGGRILIPLKPKLFFALRGDVGGFGAGSKFAWMLQPTMTWQVKPKLGMLIGFRVLKVDRESGLGPTPFNPNLFQYNVSHRGPGLGMTLSF